MPYFHGTLTIVKFDQEGFTKAFKQALMILMRNGARRFLRAALPRIPIRTGFVRGGMDVLTILVNETASGGTAGVSAAEKDIRKHINKIGSALLKAPLHQFEIARETAKKLYYKLKNNSGYRLPKGLQKFPGMSSIFTSLRTILKINRSQNKKGKVPKLGTFEQAVGAFREKKSTLGKTYRSKERVVIRRANQHAIQPIRVIGGKREYYYGAGGKILKTPENARQFATPPDQIFKETEFGVEFNFEVDITYFHINEFFGGHAPTAPWRSMEAGRQAFQNYMRVEGLQQLPKLENFLVETEVAFGPNGVGAERRKDYIERYTPPRED